MFFFEDWQSLWRRSKLNGDPQIAYDEWQARYTEPHRFYHGLEHIADGLRLWQMIKRHSPATFSHVPPSEYLDFKWAWLYHDAVYSVDRDEYPDNERRSAELAANVLRSSRYSQSRVHRIYLLIHDTKHQATPATTLGKVITD